MPDLEIGGIDGGEISEPSCQFMGCYHDRRLPGQSQIADPKARFGVAELDPPNIAALIIPSQLCQVYCFGQHDD